MLKLNLDKKTLFLLVFTGVLILELFFFMPWTIVRLAAVNKGVRQLKSKAAMVESEWHNKDSYLERNSQLRKDVEKLKIKIFPFSQQASVLSFISSESEKFNVIINSLQPLAIQEYASTDFGDFKYLPVAMSVKANFHNLKNFIEYLQSYEAFFAVRRLNISSGEPDTLADVEIGVLVKEEL